VWAAVATALAYDLEDPLAAHTTQAIAFDGEGRFEESLRAFEAAAKFSPSTATYVNLGVCLMRRASASRDRSQKEFFYVRARDAMARGKGFAVNREDDKLFRENWDALATNFRLEGVRAPLDVDESLVVDESDRQMCGPPPDRAALEAERVADERPPEVSRPFLLHQRDVPLAEPLPRISAQEKKMPSRYAERRDPFVLVGAMSDGWRDASANEAAAWRLLEDLAAWFPDAVVDFYPYNMLSKARQSPYLTRLPTAVSELRRRNGDAASKFRYDATAKPGRYLHLQLTPAAWRELEHRGVLPADRHPHLHNDQWLDECLGGGALKDEFHLKTHWKVLLAGARGAGMFNHSDTLQTSSWHAHLAGQKWWYLCGTLDGGGGGTTTAAAASNPFCAS